MIVLRREDFVDSAVFDSILEGEGVEETHNRDRDGDDEVTIWVRHVEYKEAS